MSTTTASPLPLEDWDPSLSHVIEDMKGRPLNVHSLLANHPALLRAWWDFRNYSVAGGDLGARGGELVILRTAVHLKAWYEWGSHVDRGLACGLSMEEIDRVKRGPLDEAWSEADRLLLQAVDELFAEQAISAETQSELAKHYSVRELMDIMAIHGMYVILGCMINTWGLELDAHVQARLPEETTKESFEAEFPRK